MKCRIWAWLLGNRKGDLIPLFQIAESASAFPSHPANRSKRWAVPPTLPSHPFSQVNKCQQILHSEKFLKYDSGSRWAHSLQSLYIAEEVRFTSGWAVWMENGSAWMKGRHAVCCSTEQLPEIIRQGMDLICMTYWDKSLPCFCYLESDPGVATGNELFQPAGHSCAL